MTATTRNIIEELRRAATEQGAGEAVRTIAGPALETWMRALDGKDADPERLDDLRDLMNRDASRHPPRITEKRQAGPATGGPSERVPARIRRADGDGPRRAKGLTPPLCKPRPAHAAGPHPDAAPRQAGRRRNGRSPIRRRSRAAGMSAPGMQGPQRGHHRIPSASTPRTRHDSPARNPPQGAGRTIFSFRPVGFASGSYRRRGTRQRATQRAAPGAIAQ